MCKAEEPANPNSNGEPMKFNGCQHPRMEHSLSEKEVAEALWQLLDDIDTASDMFKPRCEKSYGNFYRYTMKKVGERFKWITSDGYKLEWIRQKEETP